MGRRRMKTNGDEKETHLAETTATYALGVFCQLVNPYISGVDHHKKGFMKDFFDAVLEGDILSNPPSPASSNPQTWENHDYRWGLGWNQRN